MGLGRATLGSRMTILDGALSQWGLNGSGAPAVTKAAGRGDLCRLFAELGYRRGAEIGVWAGEFSELLCRTIPGLELTCVDPWKAYKTYNERKNNQARLDGAYREAIARLAPFDCTLLRMTSLDAAARIPDRSLDFVYVDSNHQEPFISQDLAAWMPKVRSGGILSGHDYHAKPKRPHLQEVKPAVDAFTAAHRIEPWYVLAADKAPSYFWVVP